MESLDHHKKADIATDRPAYRDSRWERAVKVYTVNQESKYLLIQNVHALNVTQELVQQAALYGNIEEYRLLDDYPSEQYTDVYWIKFVNIDDARVAKRKMDNRSFFGKNLHVCYAPEYESLQDTREKLRKRREVVARKTRGGGGVHSSAPSTSHDSPTSLPRHDLPSTPSFLSHNNHMPSSAFQPLPPPLPLPISSNLQTPCQPMPLETEERGLASGSKTDRPIARDAGRSPPTPGISGEAGGIVPVFRPNTLSRVERVAAYLGGEGTSSSNARRNQVKRTASRGSTSSTSSSSSSQHLSQKHLTTSVPERSALARSCPSSVSAEKTNSSAPSPPMSGDSSIDASISLARDKMKKVFEPVADSSLSPLLKHKPKKRKRI